MLNISFAGLLPRRKRPSPEMLAAMATLYCCITTMIPQNASAQECRDPTAQEQQAVDKLIHALQDNLEPALLSHGWLANGGRTALSNPPIAKHAAPMRPLMVCSTPYEGRFTTDPTTSWGKQLTDSINYYQAQNEPADMQNMFRLMGSAEIDIRMRENLPYLNIDIPPTTTFTRLDIPGVALALQLSTPESKRSAAHQVETQLYFGNWDHAKVVSGNTAYAVPYPFGHAAGTPFIVNMVVHITATAEVAANLLKMVDWRRVAAGLTP